MKATLCCLFLLTISSLQAQLNAADQKLVKGYCKETISAYKNLSTKCKDLLIVSSESGEVLDSLFLEAYGTNYEQLEKDITVLTEAAGRSEAYDEKMLEQNGKTIKMLYVENKEGTSTFIKTISGCELLNAILILWEMDEASKDDEE